MVRAPCADAIRITEIVVQAWLYKQSDGRCDVVLQPQTSTYRPLYVWVEIGVFSVSGDGEIDTFFRSSYDDEANR